MRPVTLVDCHPACPFRPVDWKWVVAGLMIQGPPRPRRYTGDPDVKRAMAFLRAVERAGGDVTPRLAAKEPTIAGALDLRTPSRKNQRIEIEARILAGQPAEEIARLCEVPTDVVTTYETTFFDVRGRLDADMYIRHIAIGPRMYWPTIADVDVILKLFGWSYGPVFLDVLIDMLLSGDSVSAGRRRPSDPANVREMRDMLDLWLLELNPKTAPRIWALYQDFFEQQDATEAATASANPPVVGAEAPPTATAPPFDDEEERIAAANPPDDEVAPELEDTAPPIDEAGTLPAAKVGLRTA